MELKQQQSSWRTVLRIKVVESRERKNPFDALRIPLQVNKLATFSNPCLAQVIDMKS
jgi:hypothetical protein